MKLLVTGGAGFIGSNFVRYMVNKYPEYQIVNLDLLTYAGNPENLKDIENAANYKFVRGDIADREFINGLFQEEKFDYVLNFAAESHVDRSITDPGIFVQTNIQGTLALLDAAKTFGVTKYLQVSTDEVYGTLGETGYFTEETPLAANSPYSASKAGADLLVRAYHETFGLPVNITRCSNNYGPYHFPEKLIPLMIINALHDKELPIYGDGLNIRDWLHVEDHCQAIDLVLHKGRNGEVYNVGGNNERTNIEIVKTILKHLNKPESLMKFVKDRPGHDRRYAIDATKLRTELGWSPKYNFDTGIEQTINWYLNNREWWENIISGEYQDYVKSQYGDRLGVE
ncbi:dTDP-glucose 4,6-dehydratase [Neobacillus sp. 179-C4.2 HS]|jgi:dTDP-glucose 4,6-dehydratase|uniref:dTDP-glucose 4,6-dehydratase n=1 Tax=Neobacillus driksii TaxID=3035913 RepID=A0ABV4Z194_9BACI|nr:dTDP-glucose 4,6-dehydratase [Neobacillus sp. 179.-C4.2 HS]MDP5196677.1 dTDP-glucose 4,6-dehydratase [Neobacillus sp. 179.-C4.2 HS]